MLYVNDVKRNLKISMYKPTVLHQIHNKFLANVKLMCTHTPSES